MNKLKKENGSSMVIALIFVLIVALAVMLLYLTMSTATSRAGKAKDMEQASILTASLSKIIQDEISNGVTIYEASKDAPQIGRYVFKDAESIGRYIMNNLDTANWKYYNKEEPNHQDLSDSKITKTFDMTKEIDRSIDANEKFKCSISMYWTSDYDTENSENPDYSKRKLYVTVVTEVHNSRAGVQKNKRTSRFSFEERNAKTLDEGISEEKYYWWNYKGDVE